MSAATDLGETRRHGQLRLWPLALAALLLLANMEFLAVAEAGRPDAPMRSSQVDAPADPTDIAIIGSSAFRSSWISMSALSKSGAAIAQTPLTGDGPASARRKSHRERRIKFELLFFTALNGRSPPNPLHYC